MLKKEEQITKERRQSWWRNTFDIHICKHFSVLETVFNPQKQTNITNISLPFPFRPFFRCLLLILFPSLLSSPLLSSFSPCPLSFPPLYNLFSLHNVLEFMFPGLKVWYWVISCMLFPGEDYSALTLDPLLNISTLGWKS